MTTTTEALMALADRFASAEAGLQAGCCPQDTRDIHRAALASELTRFAALVAEHCAKVAEQSGGPDATFAAQAIREQFKEQP